MRQLVKYLCCGAALLVAGVAFGQTPAEAATPENVQKIVQEAVETEAKAQKRMDAWNEHRDALLEESRTLALEVQRLELQEKRLARYTQQAAEKIATLQHAQANYATIALQLENDMQADLTLFAALIAESAPFLQEERANRLAFITQSLSDPAIGIGEKFRRFMEALDAEATYGDKLEVAMQVASFKGKETELLTVRAGRVALYCLTPDNKAAGIWDTKKQMFSPLGGSSVEAVVALKKMATDKHFHELALLPGIKGEK